ncbi:lacZ [Symbiodinium sp. CCMP2456]|nr:lacZ [Symbiodinium sp. CCMP2456]
MGVTGWLCFSSALAALVAGAAQGDCTAQGPNRCPSTSGTSWLQMKGIARRSQVGGQEEPEFFPVHGGVDKSCAGPSTMSATDSSKETVERSLEDCKNRCLATPSCKGLDWSGSRCRVWTQHISGSLHRSGSTCLRLVPDVSVLQNFVAVNGGHGQSCRGKHAFDKEAAYYTASAAGSLEECKAACVQHPECQGISFASSGSCEIWTRPEGIEATAEDDGSVCLKVPTETTTSTAPPTEPTTTSRSKWKDWEVFWGMNCWKHHGADEFDIDPLRGQYTLQECQEACLQEPECQGVVMPQSDEHASKKTCWLRKNVHKEKCRQGHPFNFWLRPGVQLQRAGPASEAACCASFESWPNTDKVQCSGCMALVEAEPFGGRCDKYCESFGHVCYQAAEEVNENCAVKFTSRCDVAITGTSDMLCTCRHPQSMDEPKCDWPEPEPLPPTPSPDACCRNPSQWPSVDNGVTCDDCMALVVTAPYGNRCDKYCESFDHVCVAAAEEQNENCEIQYTKRCDEPIEGTSDMLCKCVKKNAPPFCPAPPAPPAPTPEPTPSPDARIQVVGKQLLVDGKPLHLKGVAWNPVPKGGRHPQDLDFARFVEEDSQIMQSMGINAVRTYEPITDTWILDTLWRRGIWVVNSVYNWGGASARDAANPVKAVKDHPAILMWSIGNEWNYNGLYVGSSFFDCIAKIRDVAKVVREFDTSHPISSIYGDTGKLDQAAQALPEIDVWGINSYRGISFGGLFDEFARITDKPMYLGEYGADAYNAKINSEDRESQARATKELTEEILSKSSVSNRGSCIGGFVFEFNDEWHKDNDGSPDDHDTGGVAPGGGPYPDRTFNEEWWGLVTIDREIRPAGREYAKTPIPGVEKLVA